MWGVEPQGEFSVEVDLTQREWDALLSLAFSQDLPKERVMVQALRLYQLVALGEATVTVPFDALRRSEMIEEIQGVLDEKDRGEAEARSNSGESGLPDGEVEQN